MGAATETAVAKVTMFMDVVGGNGGVPAGDSLLVSLFSAVVGGGDRAMAGHAKDHTGMDSGGGGGMGLLLLRVEVAGVDCGDAQKAVGSVML